MNTNLTNAQKDYAVFLPAISGFFATFIGKQRYEEYVDKTRIPSNFPTEVESMNWLEPKASMFNYHWSLYSAGHAELDVNKDAPKEKENAMSKEEVGTPSPFSKITKAHPTQGKK